MWQSLPTWVQPSENLAKEEETDSDEEVPAKVQRLDFNGVRFKCKFFCSEKDYRNEFSQKRHEKEYCPLNPASAFR